MNKKKSSLRLIVLASGLLLIPIRLICAQEQKAAVTMEAALLNKEMPNMPKMEGRDDKMDETDIEPLLKGMATVTSTDGSGNVYGTAEFTETEEGLSMSVQLSKVPNPGKHGFHIHEFGSCAEKGKSAGDHYNPEKVPHGFLPKDGAAHAHMGDMGNIDIDANGNGTLSLILPDVYLTDGEFNVAGRAIILHEKEDNFGQPTGNAGARIGCGPIVISAAQK